MGVKEYVKAFLLPVIFASTSLESFHTLRASTRSVRLTVNLILRRYLTRIGKLSELGMLIN
ncbi:MAG: hypothetical protein QW775_04765 [Ignisphaera sp.]|uniref:Uncharacterized protein n=1 Tax=Ignisphaera aggregans TaxID=334771 RepID=A0A7C4NLN8_9CREN